MCRASVQMSNIGAQLGAMQSPAAPLALEDAQLWVDLAAALLVGKERKVVRRDRLANVAQGSKKLIAQGDVLGESPRSAADVERVRVKVEPHRVPVYGSPYFEMEGLGDSRLVADIETTLLLWPDGEAVTVGELVTLLERLPKTL